MYKAVRIIGEWRAGFMIRKKTDVVEFLKGLSQGVIKVKDSDEDDLIYTIQKNENGNVSLALTRAVNITGTASPVISYQDDVDTKIFDIRKSINKQLFKR